MARKLKCWVKSPKYNTKVMTMFKNKSPEYKLFEDNYYITVGGVGRTTKEFFVNVVKQGEQVLSKTGTYSQVSKIAQSYMKKHDRC